MNTKQKLLTVALMAIMLFISACTTVVPATPTVTSTPIPPTLTFTPTPSPTPTVTPTPVSPVSISGTITNLNDVKQYLSENSFLQLIRMPDDGRITFVFAIDGTSIDSDLAQIPIPSDDGFFDVRIENIEPGKYFISAQKFNAPGGRGFNGMVIAKEADQPESIIMIEIPDSIMLPYHLDMGKVVIVLP